MPRAATRRDWRRRAGARLLEAKAGVVVVAMVPAGGATAGGANSHHPVPVAAGSAVSKAGCWAEISGKATKVAGKAAGKWAASGAASLVMVA